MHGKVRPTRPKIKPLLDLLQYLIVLIIFRKGEPHSASIRPLQVLLAEGEGLVVAHQMVVVTGELEEVGVHQHAPLAGVEGGEHLSHGGEADLVLPEHSPLLHQEGTAGDGRVGVPRGVVVQTEDVALGEQVEEDRGGEGEEADDGDEGRLQSQALRGQAGLEEDVRHQTQAGAAAGVREHLHS